ncbi:isochorismatase family protein [Streptomyces flaveus]|uniref:isochorismatase family protein n=1 Tax=Streptomyces flaveus TaxID=66370 RepID=UPI0033241840
MIGETMDDVLLDIRYETALQQPPWGDRARTEQVRKELANRPPLVEARDVDGLHALLTRVATGEAHVMQAGDAVEAFTHDIQPFLVADAVADFSADDHRLAVEYAARRCAVVTTWAT